MIDNFNCLYNLKKNELQEYLAGGSDCPAGAAPRSSSAGLERGSIFSKFQRGQACP